MAKRTGLPSHNWLVTTVVAALVGAVSAVAVIGVAWWLLMPLGGSRDLATPTPKPMPIQPQPRSHSQPAPLNALQALNAEFRATYAAARKTLLQSALATDPLLISVGDELVFRFGDRRHAVTVVPPMYHHLKAVAHAPLAVVVAVSVYSGPGEQLLPQTVGHLKRIIELSAAAEAALGSFDFSAEQRQRQTTLLQHTQAFAKTLLERGVAPPAAQVNEFARSLQPLIMANTDDAAVLQLNRMHAAVTEWRKAYVKASDLATMRAIVIGPQLPRAGNLAVQYFAKLLGERGEGSRIIYAESLWEEHHAVNLLGTHLLDRRAAVAFFDDADRLHRDLLADAAARHLKTMNFGD